MTQSVRPTPVRARLLGLFEREEGLPLPDDEFNSIAMEVFAYQAENNGVFGRFVESRGRTPGAVAHWSDIPMVPTTAFKRLPLLSGDPAEAEAVFRTSGTTGLGERGTHYVPDLALYHGALLPNFRRHLVPEGLRLPILSLIPDASDEPESSLSHMIRTVRGAFGDGSGGYFADEEGRPKVAEFQEALIEAERRGKPVLLVGTAFGFVHWFQAAEERAVRVRLPEGSRIMETGGFKGRSREVPRPRLYAALEAVLGVPGSRIVNEYGMTEMCSQFYEPVLVEGGRVGENGGSFEGRHHVAPPWVRTRVVDPVTLEVQPVGVPGLLCHMDLANLGSVSHLLTEDLGVETGGGFRLLGRAPGAEPRGCSLTMEALMESQLKQADRGGTGG